MALQKNKELNNGLTVNNCYIRVDTVSGYKGAVTISVNTYVSKQSFLDGSEYLEQKFYKFTPDIADDALNIFKQGYEYLKSLEDYADAIDC